MTIALPKYFSVQSKSFPGPNGPLSNTVKLQAIESANKKVSTLLASESSTKDDGRAFAQPVHEVLT